MSVDGDARDAAERARELEALLQVASAFASTLELEPLLDVILVQLGRVAAYTGSCVVVVEGDELMVLDDRGGRGPNEPNPEMTGARVPFAHAGALWDALSRGESVLVADARSDEPMARAFRETNAVRVDSPVVRNVRSLLAVPLVAGGRAIGYMHISHTEPDRFTERHAGVAMAIAHHAAAAIENARHHAERGRLAALEERQRLARDLHDSVTQSIFSAGVLADAALTQYARGSGALPATLERIRSVLGEALGDLRTLLYELQPSALAEDGLAVALEKLAGAVQMRTDVPVAYQGAAIGRIDPATETAIFRIVQEALANAAKHARATALTVTVTEADDRLVVTVTDDGVGFDPSAHSSVGPGVQRGGMGLRSMRERATAGLELHIESASGRGTRVTVSTPLAPLAARPA